MYRASWPDERVLRGTLAALPDAAEAEAITRTALVLVGDFLGDTYELSKLYDPAFEHGYRHGKAEP